MKHVLSRQRLLDSAGIHRHGIVVWFFLSDFTALIQGFAGLGVGYGSTRPFSGVSEFRL